MRLTALLVLTTSTGIAVAQSPAPTPPLKPAATFEVASVKRVVSDDIPSGVRPVDAGGRFTAVVTVANLIRVAYGYPVALLRDQLTGGPAWMNDERFEIVAKADGALSETPDGPPVRLFQMMRALLAERFGLRHHTETRQVPVYDLAVDRTDGKLGAGLIPSTGRCVSPLQATGPADRDRLCGLRVNGSLVSGQGVTLDVLAGRLSYFPDVQRIVRDATGLAGSFDFEFEYAPALPLAGPGQTSPTPDSPLPTLFTALREQLGLRLRAGTGPMDVLVIDRLERPTLD